MALIKCPECGKEISDKASACPNCGCPSSEWSEIIDNKEPERCRYCGCKSIGKDGYCEVCGRKHVLPYRISIPTPQQEIIKMEESPYKKEEPPYKFEGIYRHTLFGGLQEVRCPICHSEDCSHYKEEKIRPGKTKTTYSLNLNPLKPFTVVNKKEKVKRKEKVITESKFICNKCGHVFY